jgi:hypothetical protein
LFSSTSREDNKTVMRSSFWPALNMQIKRMGGRCEACF